MSESQEPQLAPVFPEDQGTTMALIDINKDAIGSKVMKEALATHTGSTDHGSSVLATHLGRIDGVQPPTTNNPPETAIYVRPSEIISSTPYYQARFE